MLRSRLLGVSVFVLLIAGCTDPESPLGSAATDETEASETTEVAPGIVVPVNRGALQGTVRADGGLPIKGARASLLGTDHFQDTDAGGNFTFEDLIAGDYELSVTAEGFQAHSEKLRVEAGRLSRADITLQLDEDLDAAYRPHLHDYWNERPEVTLMDADVDLSSREANGNSGVYSDPLYARTGKANDNRSAQATDAWYFTIKPANSQDPPIIFPGTRELRITFTWTQDNVRLDQLGLIYSNPATPAKVITPPKASPATWVIPVTPESSDDGHQLTSAWSFYIYTPNDKDQPTTWKPGLVMGPMHVKMVLVKGDLYLEPEHPTFWDQGDELLVRSSSTAVKFTITDRTGGQGGLRPDTKKMVPPGTGKLQIKFWYYYDDALNGTRGHEWVLTWRTPAQDPATPLAQYKRAAPAQESTGFKLYEIDLAEEDWDPYYATSSRWLWLPSPKGQEDANQLGNNEDYYRGQATGGLKFRLAVHAFKDAEFK